MPTSRGSGISDALETLDAFLIHDASEDAAGCGDRVGWDARRRDRYRAARER